jgi:hypothetical protein
VRVRQNGRYEEPGGWALWAVCSHSGWDPPGRGSPARICGGTTTPRARNEWGYASRSEFAGSFDSAGFGRFSDCWNQGFPTWKFFCGAANNFSNPAVPFIGHKKNRCLELKCRCTVVDIGNGSSKIFLPSGKHRVAPCYSMFSFAPWHFLYFLPLPHGQGSLRPTLGCSSRICLTLTSPWGA